MAATTRENLFIASTITSVGSIAAGTLGLASAASRRLTGFSITERASAAAQFVLHHGTSSAGVVIAWVSLTANQIIQRDYGVAGVAVPDGVFVERESGTARVTLEHKTIR